MVNSSEGVVHVCAPSLIYLFDDNRLDSSELKWSFNIYMSTCLACDSFVVPGRAQLPCLSLYIILQIQSVFCRALGSLHAVERFPTST